ncbi:hypothetical protein [Streptomyces violarus]|uniref:Uncharacterized protein n=1 Tax=Streptomyces violarus TaxID=67380 RepID=A0A7W5F3G0_9ACTN|nr:MULTISPECIES: hypothetical protein [Streptomyces]MBB3078645.1 hypothetical protein [Streptomyces violarus]WRU03179.1 hypothetical protein VJ737_38250 [Streptomyces sp. CGMCC 4.1772]
MSYDLKAVIARNSLLAAMASTLPSARVVGLQQGLALLPVSDALSDAVTDRAQPRRTDFWSLPSGFDRVLAEWSEAGSIAYVEAEYFGGTGEENVAVWRDGRLVLGPLHLLDGELPPSDGTPVCLALREVGVRAAEEEDEFTTVGLGKHRNTEGWAGKST